MNRLLAFILALALTLTSNTAAFAAVGDAAKNESACLQDIASAMGREQRLYRAVLFGRTKAIDAPTGEVRYTNAGTMYLKKGANSWQPLTGDPLNNNEMDDQQEKDVLCGSAPTCLETPHKGIFTVRGAMTSDPNILPALLQAQRALTYRALAVCDAAVKSMNKTAGSTVTTSVLGGLAMEMPALTGCAFAGTDEWLAARLSMTERCREIADGMIQSEQELLELLVAYDSGVRSLYQFAGGFDRFLTGWKETLSGPLWQMTRILRWLPKIPCFLSSCAE